MSVAKLTRPYPHFKFPNEIIIEVKKLSDKDCQWFGVALGSYELRCTNYGWFPNDGLMGVIDGKYEDTKGTGAKISGNMGTAGIAATNLPLCIELLTKAGYTLI